MRRLYVAPLDVYEAMRHLFSTHLTTHWVGLVNMEQDPKLIAWEAAGKPVAVSTEFLREHPEAVWSEHPDVTALPHPVWHGSQPITYAREMPENQLQGQTGIKTRLVKRLPSLLATHMAPASWGSSLTGEDEANIYRDGVDDLVQSGLGLTEEHTVLDVHRVLAAVHPGFRLRALR